MSPKTNFKKPPIGIKPKYVWDQERLDDLIDAMERYRNDDRQIPVTWLDEYNELIEIEPDAKKSDDWNEWKFLIGFIAGLIAAGLTFQFIL